MECLKIMAEIAATGRRLSALDGTQRDTSSGIYFDLLDRVHAEIVNLQGLQDELRNQVGRPGCATEGYKKASPPARN